jgi:hypothetical protein
MVDQAFMKVALWVSRIESTIRASGGAQGTMVPGNEGDALCKV